MQRQTGQALNCDANECERGHCCAGTAECREGNALILRDCCRYNVMRVGIFNVVWLQAYYMYVGLCIRIKAGY